MQITAMERLEIYLSSAPASAMFFAMAVPAAERMRRLRERRANGIRVVDVEIDDQIIKRLVDQGHVSKDAKSDAFALAYDIRMVLGKLVGIDTEGDEIEENS